MANILKLKLFTIFMLFFNLCLSQSIEELENDKRSWESLTLDGYIKNQDLLEIYGSFANLGSVYLVDQIGKNEESRVYDVYYIDRNGIEKRNTVRKQSVYRKKDFEDKKKYYLDEINKNIVNYETLQSKKRYEREKYLERLKKERGILEKQKVVELDRLEKETDSLIFLHNLKVEKLYNHFNFHDNFYNRQRDLGNKFERLPFFEVLDNTIPQIDVGYNEMMTYVNRIIIDSSLTHEKFKEYFESYNVFFRGEGRPIPDSYEGYPIINDTINYWSFEKILGFDKNDEEILGFDKNYYKRKGTNTFGLRSYSYDNKKYISLNPQASLMVFIIKYLGEENLKYFNYENLLQRGWVRSFLEKKIKIFKVYNRKDSETKHRFYSESGFGRPYDYDDSIFLIQSFYLNTREDINNGEFNSDARNYYYKEINNKFTQLEKILSITTRFRDYYDIEKNDYSDDYRLFEKELIRKINDLKLYLYTSNICDDYFETAYSGYITVKNKSHKRFLKYLDKSSPEILKYYNQYNGLINIDEIISFYDKEDHEITLSKINRLEKLLQEF